MLKRKPRIPQVLLRGLTTVRAARATIRTARDVATLHQAAA